MRKILKGEQVSRGVHIRGNTAVVNHVTKASEESEVGYLLTWEFDFQGVTVPELMDIAAGALTIGERPPFKKALKDSKDQDTTAEEWDNKTFSVRDLIDDARKSKADPVTKAKNALGKLSEADRKALLEALSKEVEE